MRVFNFSAGPSALPTNVLETAKEELLDFQNAGMSVMEMSHRGKTFESVISTAEQNVRKLMNISDEYSVLFMQGGASHQFAMIPLNFLAEGISADFINTGSWAGKAINEAKGIGVANVVWSGKDEKYKRVPKQTEYKLNKTSAYTHITSNETIEGIQFKEFPKTENPLMCDMSSDIMSRVFDVNQFGLIYAGAQKNIGPSGLALVIIKKNLLECSQKNIPIFFRYKTHSEEGSMYNTPNTWAIYLLKLVTDKLLENGGISAVEKINEEKAKRLYSTLDASEYWRTHADKDSRSLMNIVWRLPSEELEDKFVKEAKKAGLDGLKGHRSVGGIRASIYNAIGLDAVDALISFMNEFEKKNG